MNLNKIKVLVLPLLIIATTTLYIAGSHMFASSQLYNCIPAHLDQAKRLIHGHLTLRDIPFPFYDDAAWGNGLNQNWGLGQPIMKLPFHLVAWLFGFPEGFPDRIIDLFYLMLSISICAVAYKALAERLLKTVPSRMAFVGTLLALAFLTRPLLSIAWLITGIYGEQYCYGVYWANAAMALLLLFALEPKPRSLLFASAVLSFGCLIRPTLIVYTIVAAPFLAWLAISAYREKKIGLRSGIIAAILGVAGPLILFGTTLLRYGNPMEFGSHLMMFQPPKAYLFFDFDGPISKISWLSAAKELFGMMFLMSKDTKLIIPGNPFYGPEMITPWQAAISRPRDIHSAGFSLLTFSILVFSWVSVPLILRAKRFRFPGLSAWYGTGVVAFILLWMIHVRLPWIATRYFGDFTPAVFFPISVLVTLLFARPVPYYLLIALVPFWLAVDYWTSPEIPREIINPGMCLGSTVRRVTSAREESAKNFTANDDLLGEAAACPHSPRPELGVYPWGWDLWTDCAVSETSAFFVRGGASCYKMDYETDAQIGPGHAWAPEDIAVKSGLVTLELKSKEDTGVRHSAVFCREQTFWEGVIGRPDYDRILIRWFDPTKRYDDPKQIRLVRFGWADSR